MLTITNERLKTYTVMSDGLDDASRRTAVGAVIDYLYKVTGVKIAEGDGGENRISLILDRSLKTSHVDGFVIKPDGDDVKIIGRTNRAVVYAAFAFAGECLGVKFRNNTA